MIIKKWNTANGGSWEEQYPKTLETMIYDSNATTTPIFDSIPNDQSNRSRSRPYIKYFCFSYSLKIL